jgi:hypothetical protein
MRFLMSLDIPLIATLRDTQSYVRSAETGIGVCEMPRWQVQQELPQWQQILGWLTAERRAAKVSVSTRLGVERSAAQPARAPVTPLAGRPTTADRELDASA